MLTIARAEAAGEEDSKLSPAAAAVAVAAAAAAEAAEVE